MNHHRDCNRTGDNHVPIPYLSQFSMADQRKKVDPHTNWAQDRLNRLNSFRFPGAAVSASSPKHSRTAVRPSNTPNLGLGER